MLLPLALSPNSSITSRNFLGLASVVVSAPISVKVAPVSFWPAAGKYPQQTIAQTINRNKLFNTDFLVWNIMNEALKNGVVIQGFCVRVKRQDTFFKSNELFSHVINSATEIYKCPF